MLCVYMYSNNHFFDYIKTDLVIDITLLTKPINNFSLIYHTKWLMIWFYLISSHLNHIPSTLNIIMYHQLYVIMFLIFFKFK